MKPGKCATNTRQTVNRLLTSASAWIQLINCKTRQHLAVQSRNRRISALPHATCEWQPYQVLPWSRIAIQSAKYDYAEFSKIAGQVNMPISATRVSPASGQAESRDSFQVA